MKRMMSSIAVVIVVIAIAVSAVTASASQSNWNGTVGGVSVHAQKMCGSSPPLGMLTCLAEPPKVSTL
jgi:opacity protein-like surface antigen